ncbi:hypothetical protein [Actinoplanes sp. NPDC089786]|uniref:hypothetical protein n=1 Tax=Actinoplanes sp. NPDC089786 TaxID=3155185 RepID=UPI00344997C4
MTETGAMPIATGESQPITKWFDGGWFNCPWCETPNPPEAQQPQHCGNPACWASKYATADSVRADQQRRAAQATEREQRRLAAEAQAAAQQRYRDERVALWAERVRHRHRTRRLHDLPACVSLGDTTAVSATPQAGLPRRDRVGHGQPKSQSARSRSPTCYSPNFPTRQEALIQMPSIKVSNEA